VIASRPAPATHSERKMLQAFGAISHRRRLRVSLSRSIPAPAPWPAGGGARANISSAAFWLVGRRDQPPAAEITVENVGLTTRTGILECLSRCASIERFNLREVAGEPAAIEVRAMGPCPLPDAGDLFPVCVDEIPCWRWRPVARGHQPCR